MLKAFELPSSVSHFRIVWQVTAEGVESSNPTRIPSALRNRWCVIAAKEGRGTLTLWGGISLPEAPDTVIWDTITFVTISSPATFKVNLSDEFPYHFYRVQFEKETNYTGAIDIWVLVEGNL